MIGREKSRIGGTKDTNNWAGMSQRHCVNRQNIGKFSPFNPSQLCKNGGDKNGLKISQNGLKLAGVILNFNILLILQT